MPKEWAPYGHKKNAKRKDVKKTYIKKVRSKGKDPFSKGKGKIKPVTSTTILNPESWGKYT